MAQQLRALAVLLKDPGSIPNPRWQLTPVSAVPAGRDPIPLHKHACKQNTNAHKTNH